MGVLQTRRVQFTIGVNDRIRVCEQSERTSSSCEWSGVLPLFLDKTPHPPPPPGGFSSKTRGGEGFVQRGRGFWEVFTVSGGSSSFNLVCAVWDPYKAHTTDSKESMSFKNLHVAVVL